MGATELWLVRHGESTANVAAAVAQQRGEEEIDVDSRDADVALSGLGRDQAAALGNWLADNSTLAKPGAVWASSYRRAQETVTIAMAEARLTLPVRVDERLRDRELGVLDRLTTRGVEARFPEEAERRRWLGKFYYRPPGGESWADVALRLRSFLRDVDFYDDGECVLVAAHDAVILIFLYVCNGLSEQELLDFSLNNTVANASVTKLVRPTGRGTWSLDVFSAQGHLADASITSTEHAGDKDADIH